MVIPSPLNITAGFAYDGSYVYCASVGKVLRRRLSALGDVNRDYAVTAYDAALAARIAVGLDPLGDKLQKADVSGDGQVTAYDAALIAQKAVGLISQFPVEL